MNNLNILKVLEEKFDVPQHELLEFIKSSPRKYKVYQIPKRTSGTRTIAQPTAELKVSTVFGFYIYPYSTCT